MTVVEVNGLIGKAPDRDRFVCLDGIHMTEPYHRLMARQWLSFLVGARDRARGVDWRSASSTRRASWGARRRRGRPR